MFAQYNNKATIETGKFDTSYGPWLYVNILYIKINANFYWKMFARNVARTCANPFHEQPTDSAVVSL